MEDCGAMSVFSPRKLRDALGLFATGVAVVTTTTAEGERIGATVSSFSSVSLEPPLVLFSMARQSRAFAAWIAAHQFAVNVLAQDQQTLSKKFSQAMSDKWDGVECLSGSGGAPLLADSLASFECERYAHYDGGDHLIIVGRVMGLQIKARAGVSPLVFFRSRYEQLAAGRASDVQVEPVAFQCGW
jgi:flavin reductase (DIM6/NTAB) family NADH-FMN oxidoreductase RutF